MTRTLTVLTNGLMDALMPGLVPGIHVFLPAPSEKRDVDGRDKPGHDGGARRPGYALACRCARSDRTASMLTSMWELERRTALADHVLNDVGAVELWGFESFRACPQLSKMTAAAN
jgi:hypothetical protein